MRKICVMIIRLWQRLLSPLYPPSCRYHPTCSEYAILSIEKYGVVKGGLKALWRVLRCHPLSKGGVDYP
ncbi:MAG: membrane protein insertion efficiency factor YidD [Hydrogenobacter thermophilus]|uniref:membrane protein insertion efficiency factor YidD n=1 Tax=Hydrogenobacter thermophilus TaxID=940 RepID=UPI001C77518E|nr:membrane protein insertion efficiency factor YidD [Hydrogenobacter thermophilus]QWK18906.1 MAG: membrane protein insertion efficiency factor YidD [Hydrogenobacter thermophilus]